MGSPPLVATPWMVQILPLHHHARGVGTNGLPRKTPSSAKSTFSPCFLDVETWPRMQQKAAAPSIVREQPEIFCRTLTIRTSLSARLLSNGTLKSCMNLSTASRYLYNRPTRSCPSFGLDLHAPYSLLPRSSRRPRCCPPLCCPRCDEEVRTNRYEPTRIATNRAMATANSRYSDPPVTVSTAMAASAATPSPASTAIVVSMLLSNAPPSSAKHRPYAARVTTRVATAPVRARPRRPRCARLPSSPQP